MTALSRSSTTIGAFGTARLEPSAVMLLAFVIATGVAAAWFAAPILWLVTPAVAAVILRAAHMAGDESSAGHVRLPRASQRIVDAALGQLPLGEPRDLLCAVIAPAAALLATRDSDFDARANTVLHENVAGLVDACCATALELARLDASFASHARAVGRDPQNAHDELATRYAAARSLFVARLRDAEAALRDLYAAGVERGTPSSNRVAELATEIQADAAARREAREELQRAFGGATSRR